MGLLETFLKIAEKTGDTFVPVKEAVLEVAPLHSVRAGFEKLHDQLTEESEESLDQERPARGYPFKPGKPRF